MLSFLKFATFIIGHLPRRLLTLFGHFLGSLVYIFDKKRRNIALENLRRAFPEKSPDEIDGIAKNVFSNLAITFFEFLNVPWLKREDLGGYVEFSGLENIDKALSKKKGVILWSAHFGNWELAGATLALKGYALDLVVRQADSPTFEEYIKWVRTRAGNRVIYKERAMRKLLMRLKENGIVVILLDQNVTRSEGVFVDFFGTPACTNKGPARLALASGAPLVPIFAVRTSKGHRMEIREEVRYIKTGDPEKDAEEITRKNTKIIEDVIRERPEQWFWVHRRWKTRPGSAD